MREVNVYFIFILLGMLQLFYIFYISLLVFFYSFIQDIFQYACIIFFKGLGYNNVTNVWFLINAVHLYFVFIKESEKSVSWFPQKY